MIADFENLSLFFFRISHLMEIEQQPDLWYRSTERKKYDIAIERIATFLVKIILHLFLKKLFKFIVYF